MASPFSDLSIAREQCSLARSLDLLADRWLLLVLREAFYGARRFSEFEDRLGISRSVLTKRLGHLVESGLLRRMPYDEPGQRTRDEYVLAKPGRDLLPVLAALMEWGDQHVAAPEGPPVHLVEAETHARVRLAFVRDADAAEIAPSNVRAKLNDSTGLA